MSRGKLKRKSTAIDMTAMCDVAFLLLSFFILTAKFKPAEAVPISIPSSVASSAAVLNTDAFIVSVDHDGKAYLELSDPGIRQKVLDGLQIVKGTQFAPDVQKAFLNANLIPVSMAAIPQYLQLTPDQIKNTSFPGIPLDSTGGELKDWVAAALQAYSGNTGDIHFIIKGDNDAKYPNIDNVLTAFKKNQVFRFQLLTSPHDAPEGSELYKEIKSGVNPENN